MQTLELSSQGKHLIDLYKHMAINGLQRENGAYIENPYNDFQLRKFREIVKPKLCEEKIKTVLDYGGGGSNWDTPGFDHKTGSSAKDYFGLDEVKIFEPARGLLKKEKADCVVCVDVLEHIFIADIPKVIEELFKLSKELLVINVACYEAAALLPNGENAHITVRNPHYWKGMIDSIASEHPSIEVMLICSEAFTNGIVFETFKSSDWDLSETFKVDQKLLGFKVV